MSGPPVPPTERERARKAIALGFLLGLVLALLARLRRVGPSQRP